MARIPRVLQRIFGSTPGLNQMGVFGSLANSSPTFSTDISVIQGLSNWLVGWYAAVVGSNSPALQDWNSFCLVVTQQLAEIFQDGVPPWETNTTYWKGSLASGATGIVYTSLVDNNQGHAVTDMSRWFAMTSPSVPQVVVGPQSFCTHATLAAAVADSSVGTNVDVYVANDLTLGTSVTHLTKAGWRIYGRSGQTLSGTSGGLSCEATGVEIHNLRFSGFTTAITGTSAWTYGRVMNCNFLSCATEVNDSSAPAGKKPVTLGNITEV